MYCFSYLPQEYGGDKLPEKIRDMCVANISFTLFKINHRKSLVGWGAGSRKISQNVLTDV